MAKADNEKLYQDFLADLKKINPKIEEILDEPTNTKLKESVLARSEMSRQMDALTAEKTQMNDFLAQEKKKIEDWSKWYGDTTKEVADMSTELKQYRDIYGQLDNAGKERVAAQVGISKDEFEKTLNSRLQERDLGALKFVDDLTDLKIEHRDRFKEKLDTSAVYKVAGENNVPLGVAYNIYIADRVQKLQETEVAERIAQARKDAVSEYVTEHKLPVLSSNNDYIHSLDVKKPLTNREERISAAVADFMQLGRK